MLLFYHKKHKTLQATPFLYIFFGLTLFFTMIIFFYLRGGIFMNKKIETSKAPAAIGPYSQAIQAGSLIITSGQLPADAATGAFPEGIEAQTRQSLENCKAILEEAGYSMSDVVKTTVFLSDMNNFAAMNGVYETFFEGVFPARSAIQVARLPKDALVEIECIASK